MFKTTRLEVSSLKDKEIILTELTAREAMELNLLSNAIPIFQFVYNVLAKISNLDEEDFKKIIVQDAIALLVYYKATFDKNKSIGETEDEELLPTDFLRDDKEEVDPKTTVEIAGKKFTPYLLLHKAIEAEKMAIKVNGTELAYLSLYTFGACYVGNVKDGVRLVLNSSAIDIKEGLEALNTLIGMVGGVSIGFPLFNGRRRFHIIAKKEVRAYALPFQDTDFCKFGF